MWRMVEMSDICNLKHLYLGSLPFTLSLKWTQFAVYEDIQQRELVLFEVTWAVDDKDESLS